MSSIDITKSIHPPGLKEKRFSYWNCFCFTLQKWRTYALLLDQKHMLVCVSQRTLQGLLSKIKMISTLINDWKNVIPIWKESKQSKRFDDKCNLSFTVNSWQVMVASGATSKCIIQIYTLTYAFKQYLWLFNLHKIDFKTDYRNLILKLFRKNGKNL